MMIHIHTSQLKQQAKFTITNRPACIVNAQDWQTEKVTNWENPVPGVTNFYFTTGAYQNELTPEIRLHQKRTK